MGTYGYCDSCQKFTYRQNDESICKRTGSYTNENGKCKQYLPDMTNFERIKNMGIEEMARFLLNTTPFCKESEFECIHGWHDVPNKCVLHAKEWLERKVSEDDKA